MSIVLGILKAFRVSCKKTTSVEGLALEILIPLLLLRARRSR
jgi:hypothetical protein